MVENTSDKTEVRYPMVYHENVSHNYFKPFTTETAVANRTNPVHNGKVGG